LYTPEEALNAKLVDEIVEPANLLARAEEEMQRWCKIPGRSYFNLLYAFASKTNFL
jgi:enoyl-CoA hydratase/carnithine racemase